MAEHSALLNQNQRQHNQQQQQHINSNEEAQAQLLHEPHDFFTEEIHRDFLAHLNNPTSTSTLSCQPPTPRPSMDHQSQPLAQQDQDQQPIRKPRTVHTIASSSLSFFSSPRIPRSSSWLFSSSSSPMRNLFPEVAATAAAAATATLPSSPLLSGAAMENRQPYPSGAMAMKSPELPDGCESNLDRHSTSASARKWPPPDITEVKLINTDNSSSNASCKDDDDGPFLTADENSDSDNTGITSGDEEEDEEETNLGGIVEGDKQQPTAAGGDTENSYSNNMDAANANSSQPEIPTNTHVVVDDKALIRKPACHFLASGLSSQKLKLGQLEANLTDKKQQLASRFVLNALLLNSWRSSGQQIKKIQTDNAQCKLQESNLGLQLRVIRHLQASDKERATESTLEAHELKAQLANLQKGMKRNTYELKSTEEELRATKESYQKLMVEKSGLKNAVVNEGERKLALERLLQQEKQHGEQNGGICSKLEIQISELEAKMKDLSRGAHQWKERVHEYEEAGWRLKKLLDSQQKDENELKKEYGLQQGRMVQLTRDRATKLQLLSQIEAQLELSLAEQNDLQHELNTSVEEIEFGERQLKEMKKTTKKLKCENHEMGQVLAEFRQKEAQRRRSLLSLLKTSKYLILLLMFGPEYALDSFFMDHLYYNQRPHRNQQREQRPQAVFIPKSIPLCQSEFLHF